LDASLELRQAGPQLSDVVEFDLVDDEAQPPGLAEEVDATSKDEDLSVLGKSRHAPRVIRKQHRVQPADAILDGEVEVPGRAPLHAAALALKKRRGQRPQLAPDLVGELGDGVRTL